MDKRHPHTRIRRRGEITKKNVDKKSPSRIPKAHIEFLYSTCCSLPRDACIIPSEIREVCEVWVNSVGFGNDGNDGMNLCQGWNV